MVACRGLFIRTNNENERMEEATEKEGGGVSGEERSKEREKVGKNMPVLFFT